MEPPHGLYSCVRTGAATAPELFLQLHCQWRQGGVTQRNIHTSTSCNMSTTCSRSGHCPCVTFTLAYPGLPRGCRWTQVREHMCQGFKLLLPTS